MKIWSPRLGYERAQLAGKGKVRTFLATLPCLWAINLNVADPPSSLYTFCDVTKSFAAPIAGNIVIGDYMRDSNGN
jgi:hypothetical protein